jgi:hypothetical protein
MEERERRALEGDDLHADRTQRADGFYERLEKAARSGCGVKIFFE